MRGFHSLILDTCSDHYQGCKYGPHGYVSIIIVVVAVVMINIVMIVIVAKIIIISSSSSGRSKSLERSFSS